MVVITGCLEYDGSEKAGHGEVPFRPHHTLPHDVRRGDLH